MLERWFWRCPAWQALPHPARSLYIELEMLYDGQNNGSIEMGVRKAMRLLRSSVNFTRKMFTELEEKGFVKPNQRGSFSWKSRHETTWILTRYQLKDKRATSEYTRWRPAEKQNPVSLGDTDGIPGRYRGAPKAPVTVSPGDIVKPDSDPLTVSPGDTPSSIPPAPSCQMRLNLRKNHMGAAPPKPAPCKPIWRKPSYVEIPTPPRTNGPAFRTLARSSGDAPEGAAGIRRRSAERRCGPAD